MKYYGKFLPGKKAVASVNVLETQGLEALRRSLCEAFNEYVVWFQFDVGAGYKVTSGPVGFMAKTTMPILIEALFAFDGLDDRDKKHRRTSNLSPKVIARVTLRAEF